MSGSWRRRTGNWHRSYRRGVPGGSLSPAERRGHRHSPLRDRRSDIPLLADHFIMRARVSTGKRVNEIPPEVLTVLSAYAWPGNVRELENVIEGSSR